MVPTNNQTQSSAEVEPTHIFEAHWDQGRLQAVIEPIPGPKDRAKKSAIQFQLAPANVFRKKPSQAEFSLTVFSIAR